jgi:hypothetical protein
VTRNLVKCFRAGGTKATSLFTNGSASSAHFFSGQENRFGGHSSSHERSAPLPRTGTVGPWTSVESRSPP